MLTAILHMFLSPLSHIRPRPARKGATESRGRTVVLKVVGIELNVHVITENFDKTFKDISDRCGIWCVFTATQ